VGKVLERLDARLRAFIEAQPVFFVATAPSGDGGHVNLSPKGYADTFVVVDAATVAYLDLTGSGAETVAHVRENGRITVMFCAFTGPPLVLRLHGRGRVLTPSDADWDLFAARFPGRPGARAIVVVDVERVSTSCGYGVPFMTPQGERPTLDQFAENKGPDGLADYHREKNAVSIDGLPALDPG
jgi:hypothetical protein